MLIGINFSCLLVASLVIGTYAENYLHYLLPVGFSKKDYTKTKTNHCDGITTDSVEDSQAQIECFNCCLGHGAPHYHLQQGFCLCFRSKKQKDASRKKLKKKYYWQKKLKELVGSSSRDDEETTAPLETQPQPQPQIGRAHV